MAILNNSGVLQQPGTLEIRSSGAVTTVTASRIDFTGTAVTSVATTDVGVLVTLTAGTGGSGSSGPPQWQEGSPSPRLATTASVYIGAGATFAENRGADNHFFVSGTVTTGSATDNVAVFGGTVFVSGNLILDSIGIASQSFIRMPVVNGDPQSPPRDTLAFYGVSRASRSFIEMVGPAGQDVILQPALFGNSIAYAGPNTTTTLTQWGANFTTSGTVSTPTRINVAVSGVAGSVGRTQFRSVANTGLGAGIRSTDTTFWRGVYTGSGGWFLHSRQNVFSNVSGSRVFFGINAAASFTGHQTDVSAAVNMIGIGWDRLHHFTGTWYIMRAGASGYIAEEITGMNRLETTGSLIDFICFAPPASDKIHVQVIEHLSTTIGVVSTTRFRNTYTASIPANTTFLRTTHGAYTATGTLGTQWELNRLYIETDY